MALLLIYAWNKWFFPLFHLPGEIRTHIGGGNAHHILLQKNNNMNNSAVNKSVLVFVVYTHIYTYTQTPIWSWSPDPSDTCRSLEIVPGRWLIDNYDNLWNHYLDIINIAHPSGREQRRFLEDRVIKKWPPVRREKERSSRSLPVGFWGLMNDDPEEWEIRLQ